MSVLDFMKERSNEFMTGFYWDKCPKPTQIQTEGRQTFHYAKASPRQRQFGTVLQNMRLDSHYYTIKTYDDCGFKVNGYVSTQDGNFWCIEAITHDEQTAEDEESLLLWESAVKTEYILRLRSVQNPWGIGT
ncbi:MAG: hypothetical protein IJX49_02895 [Clostridia bacterium]|nr:hypothetical protein [Clostridia bacterium]